MPISTKKVILFARATEGKVVHQWPVAVFNQPSGAKSYASMLRIAYKSGSHEAIAVLDPSHRKDGDGKALTEIKWSTLEVPYQPQPTFDDDETASAEDTPTS